MNYSYTNKCLLQVFGVLHLCGRPFIPEVQNHLEVKKGSLNSQCSIRHLLAMGVEIVEP